MPDQRLNRLHLPGLCNRVVLITGGTRGTGFVLASMFARCGANVVINSRSLQDAKSVAEQLADEHHVSTLAVAGDVSDAQAVDQIFGELEHWSKGVLDVLVCNAGFALIQKIWDTPLHEMSDAEVEQWFQRVRAVDLEGTRFCSRKALQMMVPAKQGSLVFVSSTPALCGYRGTPYTEAKAALLGLMRDLAVEYGKYNIRVNAVAPGNIRSGWYESLDEKKRKSLATEAPLVRWGKPDEVAGTILFLASELAGFVTGQTIVVDGGKVIR